jgi:hypothetical protein
MTELCGAPPRLEKAGLDPSLHVTVLSTTDRETSVALAAAGTLVRNLNGVIRLVAFIVVPYPLDLTQPPIPSSFTIDQTTSLARSLNLETELQICYCRGRWRSNRAMSGREIAGDHGTQEKMVVLAGKPVDAPGAFAGSSAPRCGLIRFLRMEKTHA